MQLARPASLLDSAELLHLAMAAIRDREHERAITLLKQGLEQSPDDARLLYLLGAEHAQIGLYDRAIDEIARSVALDAGMPSAHFQLGLLHLLRGDGVAARAAWQPLGALAEGDVFRVFVAGLIHLLEGDGAACAARIEQGMALCTANPALGESMGRILESVRQASVQGGAGAGAVGDAAAEPADAGAARHVLLSAYTTR